MPFVTPGKTEFEIRAILFFKSSPLSNYHFPEELTSRRKIYLHRLRYILIFTEYIFFIRYTFTTSWKVIYNLNSFWRHDAVKLLEETSF